MPRCQFCAYPEFTGGTFCISCGTRLVPGDAPVTAGAAVAVTSPATASVAAHISEPRTPPVRLPETAPADSPAVGPEAPPSSLGSAQLVTAHATTAIDPVVIPRQNDFCTGCGNALTSGDRFCRKCGKRVE